MKMKEAKAQKPEPQKKNEAAAGCLSTIIGLGILGAAGYSIYLMGQVQGWW